jgi:NAD(P)-dependent dehydrogenase (short-subunit alcohol dehydrogenase family)
MRDPGKSDLLSLSDNERLWMIKLDVDDVEQIRSAIAQAFDAVGRIDVVVSNAGYGVHGAAEEATDAQVEGIIATNLIGSIQVARAVIPFLRTQGGGKLIQVSSILGHISLPGASLYCATKWGLEGFFEALAKEVAPFGIEVNIVAPGMFPTSFYEAAERSAELSAYNEAGVIDRLPTRVDQFLDAMPGDTNRLVDAIISVGEKPQSPLRLLLGSDAYGATEFALKDRLANLEAQREIAHSTDRA